MDWWGNVSTNTTLKWRHYRAKSNSSHGFANNTGEIHPVRYAVCSGDSYWEGVSALKQAIFSDGPVSTGIWLCAGDNKPNTTVYKGGLTGYKGGIYDCPHYGCGFVGLATPPVCRRLDSIWGVAPHMGCGCLATG